MKHKLEIYVNQADANFMAGIEIGVRCCEKGMNLQAALNYGRKVLEQYPQKQPAPRAVRGE